MLGTWLYWNGTYDELVIFIQNSNVFLSRIMHLINLFEIIEGGIDNSKIGGGKVENSG